MAARLLKKLIDPTSCVIDISANKNVNRSKQTAFLINNCLSEPNCWFQSTFSGARGKNSPNLGKKTCFGKFKICPNFGQFGPSGLWKLFCCYSSIKTGKFGNFKKLTRRVVSATKKSIHKDRSKMFHIENLIDSITPNNSAFDI